MSMVDRRQFSELRDGADGQDSKYSAQALLHAPMRRGLVRAVSETGERMSLWGGGGGGDYEERWMNLL